MSTVLIIPGLQSSGPTHWQTWIERRLAGAVRVSQQNWNDPHLPEWSSRVRRAISQAETPVFLIAHSFGALAAVQAASDHAAQVGGVLLVAPADPEHFGVSEFLPRTPLPFPVIVVASANDPWMKLDRAEAWADAWGAELLNLGNAGHINGETGYGPWPQGLALFERLRRAAEYRSAHELSAAKSLSRQVKQARSREARPPRFNDDHIAIRRAAALLEEAGWVVREPERASA